MPQKLIRDININYEIIGDGQPLLFIHGLGSSLRDWEDQVPVFSKKFKVITLDLRGHGQSDGELSEQVISSGLSDLLLVIDAITDRAFSFPPRSLFTYILSKFSGKCSNSDLDFRSHHFISG